VRGALQHQPPASGQPRHPLRAVPVVIAIRARRWRFEPETIHLTKGVPVVLELTSTDVRHGFSAPDFGLHADLSPGVPQRVAFTADKDGTFRFHCHVFCGDGHEGMTGEIIVGPPGAAGQPKDPPPGVVRAAG
jgi:cytochrome c oxidase subunit 2